jgi:hypothetical protein
MAAAAGCVPRMGSRRLQSPPPKCSSQTTDGCRNAPLRSDPQGARPRRRLMRDKRRGRAGRRCREGTATRGFTLQLACRGRPAMATKGAPHRRLGAITARARRAISSVRSEAARQWNRDDGAVLPITASASILKFYSARGFSCGRGRLCVHGPVGISIAPVLATGAAVTVPLPFR